MSADRLTDDDLDASALYALGALEPADMARLEARLRRGEAALGDEIQSMNAVGALLGQAVAVPPPKALRQRLLEQLRLERTIVFIRAAQGEWQAGVVAGMRTKQLFLDEAAGRTTSLVHLDPGTAYPAHRPAGAEELYLLDGAFIVDGQALGAGDFCAAPTGISHSGAGSEGACTFILTRSTRDEIIAGRTALSAGLTFVRARELDWRDSATPGVATRLIFQDAARATGTMLVRMAPGARLPRHHHATAEQVYMIEGDGRVGGAVLGAGDFYAAPAGTIHEGATTSGGCTFLLVASRLEAVS